jgi:hypothetical protein
MSTAHRYLTAAENHRLPAFEFASLSAAQAHVYAASDASYLVRVGTGPYTYYIISHVVAGVATLVNIGGVENAGYYDMWDPDAPAASPHALDDDANTGALDPQWTLWDPGAGVYHAFTASQRGYEITATGTGSQRWSGYFTAVPASEFQFSARVGLEAPGGTTSVPRASIFVAQNLTGAPSTSDLRDIGLGCVSAGYQTNGSLWSAYNGSGSATSAQLNAQNGWFRVRCNGTTYGCDYSGDGVTWTQLQTVTLGFTPAEIGFGLATNTAIAARGVFSHFRFASGAGTSNFFTGHARGRKVRYLLTP